MKYKEWLSSWLEIYSRPTIKNRTYKKYRQQTYNYIIPMLGNYELEEISAIVLQTFVSELFKMKLAANTINGIISVLKTSLKTAEKFGVVSKQYTNSIKRPKGKEKKIESFSKEEQNKLERYILKSNRKNLFGIMFCMYTGLRIGELLALKWEDIDLSKKTVSITKTCIDSWENGKYVKEIDTPKTTCSNRVIPLPKQLVDLIKEYKKKSKGEYFVPGRSIYGAQIRGYQKTYEGVIRKLKITHKGFHSLRHTFATRALECGMDVKTLSELMGHENPTITLKRYSHSMLGHKIEMMNKLGKLIK